MNIAYVKVKKQRQADNKAKKLWEYTKFRFYSMINLVETEKYNPNVFNVMNFNERSVAKLQRKLKEQKIDYAIVEEGNDIGYPKLTGKNIMKNMLPEVISLCQKAIRPVIDEVHICTNSFNQENVDLIEELTTRVKVVNVVTNNKHYYKLERRLEEKDIFITVSSNRRKSLKKASIVINLDLENFKEYNINRNMVVIDVTEKVAVPKSFNGLIIRKVDIDTKKVLRIFSEFENFDKQSLIEAEMLKIQDYAKIRNFIKMNKIYISGLYNIRKIELSEFQRIQKLQKDTKKKTPLA